MIRVYLVTFLLLLSCTPSTNNRLTIVTGLSPIASIIKHITGDIATVQSIIPNDTDPHYFNIKPSDAVKISKADLIFILDSHFDGGLILNSQKENNIYILNKKDSHDDHSHDDHSHDDNPHLWLSFEHSMDLTDKITKILITNFPEYTQTFIKNKEKYDASIQEQFSTITNKIHTNNKKRYVIQRHPSWDYLIQELNVELIETLENSEHEQASLQKITQIINKIKQYPLEDIIIIDDEFSPPSSALQHISKETGVPIVTFNPMKTKDSTDHLHILSTYSSLLIK